MSYIVRPKVSSKEVLELKSQKLKVLNTKPDFSITTSEPKSKAIDRFKKNILIYLNTPKNKEINNINTKIEQISKNSEDISLNKTQHSVNKLKKSALEVMDKQKGFNKIKVANEEIVTKNNNDKEIQVNIKENKISEIIIKDPKINRGGKIQFYNNNKVGYNFREEHNKFQDSQKPQLEITKRIESESHKERSPVDETKQRGPKSAISYKPVVAKENKNVNDSLFQSKIHHARLNELIKRIRLIKLIQKVIRMRLKKKTKNVLKIQNAFRGYIYRKKLLKATCLYLLYQNKSIKLEKLLKSKIKVLYSELIDYLKQIPPLELSVDIILSVGQDKEATIIDIEPVVSLEKETFDMEINPEIKVMEEIPLQPIQRPQPQINYYCTKSTRTIITEFKISKILKLVKRFYNKYMKKKLNKSILSQNSKQDKQESEIISNKSKLSEVKVQASPLEVQPSYFSAFSYIPEIKLEQPEPEVVLKPRAKLPLLASAYCSKNNRLLPGQAASRLQKAMRRSILRFDLSTSYLTKRSASFVSQTFIVQSIRKVELHPIEYSKNIVFRHRFTKLRELQYMWKEKFANIVKLHQKVEAKERFVKQTTDLTNTVELFRYKVKCAFLRSVFKEMQEFQLGHICKCYLKSIFVKTFVSYFNNQCFFVYKIVSYKQFSKKVSMLFAGRLREVLRKIQVYSLMKGQAKELKAKEEIIQNIFKHQIVRIMAKITSTNKDEKLSDFNKNDKVLKSVKINSVFDPKDYEKIFFDDLGMKKIVEQVATLKCDDMSENEENRHNLATVKEEFDEADK